MMGVCFDCLAEIDGVPNRQSCMVRGTGPACDPSFSRVACSGSEMEMTVDLAIIGAGPAGMAAARAPVADTPLIDSGGAR